jgi:AraC family transcriptional regulator
LIVAGGYAETYGRRSRDCRPETLVFHPAGERHAEHFGDRATRIFGVEFEDQWLKESPDYQTVLDAPAHFHGGPLSRLAYRLYREFRRPDNFSPLSVEAVMLDLVAKQGRYARHSALQQPAAWLLHVQELLREQCATPGSLAVLSKEAGVHPAHLARSFHHHFGCTIGDFVRQCRVERASRLLAASDMPLVQIAMTVGFTDQSHFTRTFKRLRGMVPSAYRRLSRQR